MRPNRPRIPLFYTTIHIIAVGLSRLLRSLIAFITV